MENNIKFTGIKKLDDQEITTLNRIVNNKYKKILTILKKSNKEDLENELQINVKTMNEGGRQKEYEVQVNLFSSVGRFNAKNVDWDFSKVLNKIFEKIESEINKKQRITKN